MGLDLPRGHYPKAILGAWPSAWAFWVAHGWAVCVMVSSLVLATRGRWSRRSTSPGPYRALSGLLVVPPLGVLRLVYSPHPWKSRHRTSCSYWSLCLYCHSIPLG